jgi:hypothetical protein
MVSKINTYQKNQTNIVLTAIGAWAMTLATLIGSTQISRESRQPVIVNSVHPAYSYVNTGFDLWNRNDNENETVHLPTKFDIGLRSSIIAGKK